MHPDNLNKGEIPLHVFQPEGTVENHDLTRQEDLNFNTLTGGDLSHFIEQKTEQATKDAEATVGLMTARFTNIPDVDIKYVQEANTASEHYQAQVSTANITFQNSILNTVGDIHPIDNDIKLFDSHSEALGVLGSTEKTNSEKEKTPEPYALVENKPAVIPTVARVVAPPPLPRAPEATIAEPESEPQINLDITNALDALQNAHDKSDPTPELPAWAQLDLLPDNRNFIQNLPLKSLGLVKKLFVDLPWSGITLSAKYTGYKALQGIEKTKRAYASLRKVGILYNTVKISREKTGIIKYGGTVEELNKRILGYELDIKALDKETKSAEIEKKLQDLHTKLDTATTHRTKALTRITTYEGNRDAWAGKINTILEDRIGSFTTEMLKVAPGIEQQEAWMKKLKSQRESLEATVTQVKAENTDNERISELEAKIARIDVVITKMEKEIGANQKKATYVDNLAKPWKQMKDTFTQTQPKKAA